MKERLFFVTFAIGGEYIIYMIDLHNDLITYSKLSEKDKTSRIKKDLRDGANVCYALFLGGRGSEYLKSFSWAKSLENLSIEDIGGVDDFVDILSFSPKFVTLTWNGENRYGGGAFSNACLSDEGRNVIGKLNNANIALDLSHLNRKTFFEAVERAERVLVSHTCMDKIRSHKRNVTDEQIQAVIDKNGVVGLTFVRGFLTDKDEAEIDDLVAHIDYFCSKFSFRNLAIGTDFFGTDNGVVGIDNYSDFYKIENALRSRGYSDEVICSIMNKNAEKFLLEK